MSTIEEAREQARAAQEQISNRLIGGRLGLSSTREMDKDMLALSNGLGALSALLDATEPPEIQYADSATVAALAEKIAGENAELMDRLAVKPAEDEREALADLIEDYFDGDCGRGVGSELSNVILAEGYRKGPRPITDEMVEAHAKYTYEVLLRWPEWEAEGERIRAGYRKSSRAALEAAEGARR